MKSRWPAGAGGRSLRECRQRVCRGKYGCRGRFPCRFCRANDQFCHGPVACGMITDQLRREKGASLPFDAHRCDSLVPPKVQKKRLSSHIGPSKCAIQRPQVGVQIWQQRARWTSRCWGVEVVRFVDLRPLLGVLQGLSQPPEHGLVACSGAYACTEVDSTVREPHPQTR